MTDTTTVARYLAQTLPRFGVTHVFELIGGMIATLVDELHQQPALAVISVHHEQGAGFCAEGFARISGRPSVALATSGPGATNLLTAIGSCYFDSVPVVFITGQVNRAELHVPGQGRQLGFQETDIVSMARPITKGARQIRVPAEFPEVLDWAFQTATEGRPGPVLIDIPMDIQRSPLPTAPALEAPPPVSQAAPSREERQSFLRELAVALDDSRRPLMLVGGGVRQAGAIHEFRELAGHLQVPVVTSLMGLDAIPSSSQLRVGFIGSYGNRWANWAVGEADLLLVLGSRLDVRQTGSDTAGFAKSRAIFHVDIDAGELNNRIRGCKTFVDDLAHFLDPDAIRAELPNAWRPQWQSEIDAHRSRWPDTSENLPSMGANPNRAVRRIISAWPDLRVLVTDVGQHQMWAAQSAELSADQRFITSGGMGSMGFGLPAAIGAALANPAEPVCLIAGDGGFQCNIQEMQTLARLGLPIRIVLFNNHGHGMVRQFQEAYLAKRYHSTRWGYSAPSFAAVATAYGVNAFAADSEIDLQSALAAVLDDPAAPALIELNVDPDLNAYPKMAYGKPFGSMEPLISSAEIEGT